LIDLYSMKDVSKLFGLRESRLRYWLQTGFLWPSVRRDRRFFYTFQDLVGIKAAVELLEAGVSTQSIRTGLETVREQLPACADPASKIRVCSDGKKIVVVEHDAAYEPESGQLVMAFTVANLSTRIADVLEHPSTAASDGVPRPSAEIGGTTMPHEQPSAYKCFLEGCTAEDRSDLLGAEQAYRRALDLEPSMAAGHTNLGNVLYRRGEAKTARKAYERALEFDPNQPEARFNLGNVLDELGETELAISHLRQVCSRSPTFADAHYNLGVILARVGGLSQARKHLAQYLELDPKSAWAVRARGFLRNVQEPESDEPIVKRPVA
jgi:tetratricopeptide (TPR) repeat protein